MNTHVNSTNNIETSEGKTLNEISSPIDIVKSPIEDALIPYRNNLLKLNYMSEDSINLDAKYLKPTQSRFLIEKWGMIFSANYLSKELKLKKITNFSIEDAYTVKHIYNNKCGKNDDVYYVLDLRSITGHTLKKVEIRGSAKNDLNKFQDTLSESGNYYQCMFKPDTFKTFVEQFIMPKLKKTVIIYENCGIIEPQKFLGKDFLIDKGNVYRAGIDDLIPTSDPNIFIKANGNRPFKLPQLSSSTKAAKTIAYNFLTNTIESCRENSALFLLAIGHMIMGLFFETFIKKIGVPILVIAGVSGSGKSTVVKNSIAIFGMREDFLVAGDSTAYGQQYLAQSINGVQACIDDLSDKVLTSAKLSQSIKTLFKAVPRVKMKNFGKDLDMSQTCSQVVYSTNSALPEIPELENRANVITIMNNSLDTEKYQYLDEHVLNREELSLILPELLKYSEEEVISIHSQLQEYLKEHLEDDVIPRIFHNIAYMWTGITLLEKIADYKIENLHLEVIEYAKKVAEHYKALPTPVDMLLNGLLALKNHEIINDTYHYKIKEPQHTENGRTYLIFHKDTLLTAYNRFFIGDENRKIKLSIFNNYLNVDKRVVRTDFTARYDGKGKNSVVLDITDWADAEEFTGIKIIPMSADELRDRVQESNNL